MKVLIGRMQRFCSKRVVHLMALCCVLMLGMRIGWIEAKALLAQHLLSQAWQKQLAGQADEVYKPWPWLDSQPVASIYWPGGRQQIVLAGVSGQAMAFAPGLTILDTSGRQLPLSARSDEHVLLIAAHNDTHFSELDTVANGEFISLQNTNGQVRRYIVTAHHVVDRRQPFVDIQLQPGDLLLSTCYPFNSVVSGGDQRYLLVAKPQPVPISLVYSKAG